MLNQINENIQAGSETRYFGKTGLTAAAVFASAIFLPSGFYESQSAQPLNFTYATVSGSTPSFEAQTRTSSENNNPLQALVEYFLETDEVEKEFASISRDRFFQIYERF